MNPVLNPVLVQNQAGERIDPKSHYNELGSVSTHIVLVDSRDRDLNKHVWASKFTIRLPEELRNVMSCKLLRVQIPIPTDLIDTTDGLEPFVAIRCPQLERVGQCIADGTADIPHNQFAQDAFALVPLRHDASYDTGKYVTIWEPTTNYVVKRFAPWKARLTELNISLWVRTNGLVAGEVEYPLTTEVAGSRRINANNWQMLLEFECQN